MSIGNGLNIQQYVTVDRRVIKKCKKYSYLCIPVLIESARLVIVGHHNSDSNVDNGNIRDARSFYAI